MYLITMYLIAIRYNSKNSQSVTASKITIYADDIAVYKNIQSQSDYAALQGDVTSVCNWI